VNQIIEGEAGAQKASSSDVRRLPHSALGISLGIAEVANSWGLANIHFGTPAFIPEVLFAVSGLWWLIVMLARAPLTLHRIAQLRQEFSHPADGPLLAYVPVIALLLTIHYGPYIGSTAHSTLTLVFVAALALVCARLLSHWMSGELRLEQIHPGYALPVIAGSFIASMALMSAGFESLAFAAAAVGAFYWLSLGTIIFLRLLQGPQLPVPLRPTMAVLVTPPVTAGLAWFSLCDGQIDKMQIGLAGIVVLLLLMQLFVAPTYLRDGFHKGWWAILFPLGAIASYTLRWSISSPNQLADTLAWIALSGATLVLLGLGLATIRLSIPSGRRSKSPASTTGD